MHMWLALLDESLVYSKCMEWMETSFDKSETDKRKFNDYTFFSIVTWTHFAELLDSWELLHFVSLVTVSARKQHLYSTSSHVYLLKGRLQTV